MPPAEYQSTTKIMTRKNLVQVCPLSTETASKTPKAKRAPMKEALSFDAVGLLVFLLQYQRPISRGNLRQSGPNQAYLHHRGR